MEPWLQAITAAPLNPWELVTRLLLAMLLGWVVAVIYRRTNHAGDEASSFITTLVLLAVLIAIVTQVIGDSVARAFSLVGALSIVRFRTVVRDTRDTAFVIFAVVMGMAAGASNLAVAIAGAVVVGLAAWIFRPSKEAADAPPIAALLVRLAIGQPPQQEVLPLLERASQKLKLTAVITSRRGSSLEYHYRVQLQPSHDPATLVRELNQLDGVQAVRWREVEVEE